MKASDIFQGKSKTLPIWAKFIKPYHVWKRAIFCVDLKIPYPDFTFLSPKDINIFDILQESEIRQLQTDPDARFIFDYTYEGTGHSSFFNFYEMLSYHGQRLEIPSHKIIFISSNLLEEQNYESWNKIYYPDYKIKVFSFIHWAWHVRKSKVDLPIEKSIENVINKDHFLFFNAKPRPHRIFALCEMYKRNIFKNTKSSFDKLDVDFLVDVYKKYQCNFDIKLLEQFAELSPRYIDSDHFKGYILCHVYRDDVLNTCLVHVAGETLCENDCLFYSEKTFKVMPYNCPLFIVGSVNQNTSFEKFYFKNYDKYFDLSWDSIENTGQRIIEQVKYLDRLNDEFGKMSITQKRDWFLQDTDTLLHNKQALFDQRYNREQAQRLLESL